MKLDLRLDDCIDVLGDIPPESIDAFIFDPPYGLTGENGTTATGYLGQEWDRTEIAFSKVFWGMVLDALVEGGVVKAFCGTRTFHRMAGPMAAAGLRHIGLEAWCHGGSMPSGVNLSLAVDALLLVGSTDSRALSKALSMRPVVGSKVRQVSRGRTAIKGQSRHGVVANMERWLDSESRSIPITKAATYTAESWEGWGTSLKPAWEPVRVGRKI